MKKRILPGGFIACSESSMVLDVIEDTFHRQEELDKSSKYHPNDKVEVCASLEDLIEWLLPVEHTIPNAKKEALLILSDPKGVVIGATECSDAGKCYTIETSVIPMLFLPERFIQEVR